MTDIQQEILEQVLAATAEPLLIVRVDQPDWPVALANAAFAVLAGEDVVKRPFADVVEALTDREHALEVSETVRSGQEASLPVEAGSREYLLSLRPLRVKNDKEASYYAALWRSDSGVSADAEVHHALLKAKRRIRDLSRDDPVTGLLNARAFGDVFKHDWAVAQREKSSLSLVLFALDDFDAYLDVFGRHASDSCLRRVGRAIRRSLRRASDVVARLDGERFVVLSHATDEEGVRDFAGRISAAVRELGLHHPRSTSSKFVTVSYDVHVADVRAERRVAGEFLRDLLAIESE